MSQAAATYFFTLYALVNDRFQDRKDRGATAVEYGLMVGLIAVAIIVTVGFLGGRLDGLFQQVLTALPGGGAGGGGE
ncbi:pilus assembly protein Flp/PilA [Dietzia sp. 2505]|uniref:Flp family type IVb pilin n=1 Tax=Dietzia sp. 2505 TaxID=3156457 RepID=UPI0033935977